MTEERLQPPMNSSLLGQLASSPLSGQIMRLLPAAALAELILIVSIGYCLFESGKTAEREFLLLQASSRLATVIRSGHDLWDQAGKLRREPSAREYRAYRQQQALLLNDVDSVSDVLKKARVANDIVGDTRKSLTELDDQAAEIFHRQQQGDNQGYKYKLWKQRSFQSLDKSVEMIGEVHKIIRASKQDSARFDQYVFLLMYLFFLLNIIFAVYGYHLIRSRITGPIVKLAANCDRILEGKVIPTAGAQANDEISAMEHAFRSMSFALAENDKRKKNFQDLFRNVLSRSLQAVDDGLTRTMSIASERREQSFDLLQMVQRCKSGLAHLLSILQSLSNSLNADAGKDLVVTCTDVNTSSLTERSLIAIDSLLKEKQVNIVQDVAPIAVRLDEQLMQRVVTNLLSNAIKYSPVRGQISIQVEDQGSTWQFTVRDQGPGISAAGRKKLFTRFGKLESLDGKYREGTGLGLVICKEIVEAHAGVISCESTPGVGSSFWFRLPKTGRPIPASASTVSSAQTRREAQIPIDDKFADTSTPNGQRRKIAQYYFTLLIMFICSQTAIVLFLNGRFQQVRNEASLFSIRRERLVKTEELFGNLIKGRMQIVEAFETGESSRVSEAFKNFEAYFGLTNGLTTQNFNLDQEGSRIVSQMFAREQLLLKLAKTLPQQSEQLTQIDIAMVYPPAKKAFNQLENACLSLMDIDQQSIRYSYVVASDLRRQIAFTLFVDAVVNILVFFFAIRHTFKLVQRANLLAGKARAFSNGKLPQPGTDSVTNDELSWLDQRFCQVAAQISSMEEKRQALMAVVNHDLRTPVNSMLLTLESMLDGASQTLKTAHPAPTVLMETLRSTKFALDNIFNRVNNFLLIEKLQHGSYALNREKLAVDEIIEGLSLDMPARGLIEDGCLQSDVENSDADWIVYGDRKLLETMLFHLILNASNNSSNHSPVTLQWIVGQKNQMHLDIKNVGKSINPELIPQLFERYRSVGDVAIPGLGLPLASKIAKLHQGDVELVSNLSDECVFRVTLPFS